MKVKEASKIIILNEEKEILLQLRDEKKDIPFPGYWDFFGGKIERGENPLETIKREAYEEINVVPRNIIFLGKIYVPKNNLSQESCNNFMFRGYINQTAENIDFSEGQGVRYFGLKELKGIKFVHFWLDFIIENKEKIFGD